MTTTQRRLVSHLGISLCFLILVSCVGPAPYQDHIYAKTAVEAARTAQAGRFAPGYFGQAEEAYRQGLADTEDRRYKEARENFLRARTLAEKAENYTALKKAESGETP